MRGLVAVGRHGSRALPARAKGHWRTVERAGRGRWWWWLRCLAVPGAVLAAMTVAGADTRDLRRHQTLSYTNYAGQVRSVSGWVEYSAEPEKWVPAAGDQAVAPGDRLLTGRPGRATVRLWGLAWDASQATMVLKEDSLLRLVRDAATPATATATATTRPREGQIVAVERERPAGRHFLELDHGALYFREDGVTNAFEISTPFALARPEGTEFMVAVDANRRETTVVMFDGEAELATLTERRTVRAQHLGTASLGRPIVLRPLVEATNLVQWWVHYPAVVDVDELGLAEGSAAALAESLRAYRRGNLHEAAARYPGFPDAEIAEEPARALYLAALWMAQGEVGRAGGMLAAPAWRSSPLAMAMRRVMRAFSHPLLPRPLAVDEPRPEADWTASEWLAESYVRQSAHDLRGAREAARRALTRAPRFGWAWARAAELQLSLGNLGEAEQSLTKALDVAPENPYARTLQGFLALTRNRPGLASSRFEEALAVDPQLADAWMGRGLVRGRRGDSRGAMEDFAVARVLDPGRSLVHSYAGKAFADAGWESDAAEALEHAQVLDPNDPTPSLYRAILDQQENRMTSAVTNLEQSLALNGQRAVYRSRLLLDQDAAVRGANLAAVYQEAGLDEFAIRQATQAVDNDYTSFSAHQFLADSYNSMRDPGQVGLRYETAWFSEYLVANLLAPVGASRLSTAVSPNEYSRFFQRDGAGLSSRSEYTSNGDWHQAASQFGTFGTFAYAVDVNYRNDRGERVNADAEQLTASTQFKQQVGLADTVFIQAVYYDAAFGDVRPVSDPENPVVLHERLRVHDHQEPLVLVGWHHPWQEGSDTLFLFARLQDRNRLQDPEYQQLSVLPADGDAGPSGKEDPTGLDYASELLAWSLEGQQAWRGERHTVVAGLRGQFGDLSTTSELERVSSRGLPELDQSVQAAFGRVAAYGYEQWEIVDRLRVFAGLTYDRLQEPLNYRLPPLTPGEDTHDQVSPKVGVSWKPWAGAALRAAYTRALGGVSLEQSVRLEPTQVAGLNQAYRGLIPEALSGSVAGQEMDLWGAGFEQRLPARTYLTLAVERRNSAAERLVGGQEYNWDRLDWSPVGLREELRYEEWMGAVSVHHLATRNVSVGADYRVTDASLTSSQPEIGRERYGQSWLHQLILASRVAVPVGFFGGLEAVWTRQANRGSLVPGPGDDFWQLNLEAGWRSSGRRFEMATGVLNVTGQDYRLEPLSPYLEPRRNATWFLSIRFEL